MGEELTVEKLLTLSKLAGLNLTDDELRRLLPAISRSLKQVEELRDLIKATDEPAAMFIASRGKQQT